MAIRPRIVRAIVATDGRHDLGSDEADGDDAAMATEPGDAAEFAAETAEAVDPDFDETTYLRAFPDIAEAVRRGVLTSGLEHFRRAGRAEARLDKAEYRALARGLRRSGGAATRDRYADHLARPAQR